MKNPLRTPILLIIFNRLDTTKKVFAEIRKAKPKQIFIASDGPREEKMKEKEIVEKVRKYVLDNIDWQCEVKTLFREKNLGCKYAVSGAITWFFDNVEQGIILEDDCLPNQSFFRFCQEMLNKYKFHKKITHINGTNFISIKTRNNKEDYFFSNSVFIWGWATWRRAWKKYDVEINKKIRFFDILKASRGPLDFIQNLKLLFSLNNGNVDTWDIQRYLEIKIKNELCITPNKNLVKNVGFDSLSFTNNKNDPIDRKYLYIVTEELKFPLKHPKTIKRNYLLDSAINRLTLKRVMLKKVNMLLKIK